MLNKLLYITTLLYSLAFVNSTNFIDYVKSYDKTYADEEMFDRYNIFSENLRIINEHNSNPEHTWKMGVNQFTDLSADEFKQQLCYKKDTIYNVPRVVLDLHTTKDIPTQLDWTELGAVTPVKDQGHCGSCWSFSTTGSLEGAYFLKNHTLESFSEQQLIDCSSSYGNKGCNGGLMDLAFEYVKDHGICKESEYPYIGKKSRKCRKCAIVTKVKSYTDVLPNDEQALLVAINIQPVSVAIEADQSIFQFYSSGVLTAKCGSDLDHGVLLVGYGTTEAGIDYWKVKNSWGPKWGDNGYILLQRNVKNKEGQCGIAMQPSFPIIA